MPAKIEKRGDNKYRLTVYQGRDAKGKQIIRTKTIEATSDRAAEKQYSLFVAEIEKGQFSTSGKMTLAKFYTYWVDNFSKVHHGEKTQAQYRSCWSRVELALGHKRINQIEPKHIIAFLKNISESGISNRKNCDFLSPATIRRYYIFLHLMFEKAKQWKFISYNPVDDVDAPKLKKTQKPIYDKDQTTIFFNLLDKESLKHRTMIYLLFTSGARRGEMYGLKWGDVNFNNNSIYIQRTIQYLPTKGIFTTESNENKNHDRLVTLPHMVMDLLREYKIECEDRKNKIEDQWIGQENINDNYIFTTWNGSVSHPDGINTWLSRFLKKHSLPKITPHSFRHMAATFLINAGIDLQTVASKLGHANTTTTQVVYSHLLEKSEQETVNVFSDVLGGDSRL